MARVVPGKVYRLISSHSGPNGISVGRKCRTIHQQPVDHIEHGPLWYVESADGKEFVSHMGATGMYITVAEDWLEEIPEDPPEELPRVTEKDLDKVV
jgi:hypothetical protein